MGSWSSGFGGGEGREMRGEIVRCFVWFFYFDGYSMVIKIYIKINV